MNAALLPKAARKLMNPAYPATREYLTQLVHAGDVAALERMLAACGHPQTRQLLRLALAHATRNRK